MCPPEITSRSLLFPGKGTGAQRSIFDELCLTAEERDSEYEPGEDGEQRNE